MIGVLAALVASIFATSKNLCSKSLTQYISAGFSTLCSFWFAIPFYLILLIYLGWNEVPIFALGAPFYGYVLLRALSDMFGESCRMHALEKGDISLVAGFLALAPFFLLFTSPLITGDIPSQNGVIGVVLTTAGVFVLVGGNFRVHGARSAILWATAGAFFIGINSCFDRLATLEAHPIVSGFWMTIVAGLFLIPSNMKNLRSPGGGAFPWRILLLRGLLEMLFMSTKLYALRYLQAPYVAALLKFGLIFSILGGGLLFKEKEIKRRLLGGVIIIIGTVIIILG